MYRLSSSNLIRKGLARVHLFVLSLKYRYALCSTRYADKTAPTFLWIAPTHKCNIARPDPGPPAQKGLNFMPFSQKRYF